ncbi:hypothetical protein CJD38_11680 [Stenotrophobium rhamnosiphilum]|uniref:Uncharacterized protein n=1 Tax=Stenotrophobium rhamnosiphilum TaxID=2029166 RepID=A0A2T5MEF0_9GAMM|nr:hypothetical protein CJD38_11680 [Stenotrophobium rhamnosiphilum]
MGGQPLAQRKRCLASGTAEPLGVAAPQVQRATMKGWNIHCFFLSLAQLAPFLAVLVTLVQQFKAAA